MLNARQVKTILRSHFFVVIFRGYTMLSLNIFFQSISDMSYVPIDALRLIVLSNSNSIRYTVFALHILVAVNRTVADWEERGIATTLIVWVTLRHTFHPIWGVRVMNVVGSIKFFKIFRPVAKCALRLDSCHDTPKHSKSRNALGLKHPQSLLPTFVASIELLNQMSKVLSNADRFTFLGFMRVCRTDLVLY